MKHSKRILAAFSAIAILLAAGCTKEEEENFSFSVTNEKGTAVSGTQVFTYGESKDYPFTATEVSRTVFETPEGWSAQMVQAEKVIRITSPDPKNEKLEENGIVKITASSYQGKTIVVDINVSVKDSEVLFTLDGVKEGVAVRYSETVELQATASNVAKVQTTAPKGWKVAYDETSAKLSITAPGFKDSDYDVEGKVTVSPLSARGNAGTQLSFDVYILTTDPVLVLDNNNLDRVVHGSTTVLNSVEYANIDSIEKTSVPEGWNVEFEKGTESVKVTVTAPAVGSGKYVGAGEIVLGLTSPAGEQAESKITVSMKGINTAADFIDFADAYTKNEDCSKYIDNEEYILNSDIDITDTPRALYVNRNFGYTFNGDGHTITYKIKAETGDAGLFQTVEGTGVIKNLNIAGTLEITDKTDRAAGVASYSIGATFENITSTVKYSQEGGSRGLFLGGIVADETRLGTYRNCHNKGEFNVNAMQFLGGLIADVWDNPGSKMYDCSNEADFNINMNGINMGNSWFGGLIGKSDGSDFSIYRSYNKGNFKLDFGGARTNLAGVGGIAGFGCGYYEDCYNEGNITDVNKDDISGSARIGGLVGCVKNAKGYMLKATNCYNKGNITALGAGVGGLIGIVRDGPADAMVLKNCRNEGKVDCRSEISAVQSFGGLIGTVYNYLDMIDCTNSADVMGYTSMGGAGLVGRAADNLTVTNCTNTGNVYVGAHSDAINNFPLAAGLVVGVYPATTITKSKNTGNIYAMVIKEGCASKTYVSDRLLSGNADNSTVDDETIKNSEGAVITLIMKDGWKDTFPEGWPK